MGDIRISQSLIKELLEYQDGKSCGLQLEEKFIKNNFHKFIASDSMSVGTWFEYELTGALPKGNSTPNPKTTTTGKLTSVYEKMIPHIDNFKTAMYFYGLELVSAGEKIKYGDLEGTLDIRAKATKDIVTDSGNVIKAGSQIIIDIKTSGLLDNKWSDYGWEIENLSNKIKIILQPLMYKYIEMKNTGRDIPFVFMLFNTADNTDCRIINFICSDDSFETLESLLVKIRKLLAYHISIGWKARPNMRVCAKCPIKVGCRHFAVAPPFQDFYFDSANI